MYLNIHKNFGNCARFGSMLISSILGIVCLAGNPAHKGAETVNGRNERSLRQAPAEEKEAQKGLDRTGGCDPRCGGILSAAEKGRQYAGGSGLRYAGAGICRSGIEHQRDRNRGKQRHNEGLFDACLPGQERAGRGWRHCKGRRLAGGARRRADRKPDRHAENLHGGRLRQRGRAGAERVRRVR